MTRLTCENEFCIYQKKGNCILDKVRLDIQGNCADCIYIRVEESMLIALKEKELRKT